MLDPATIGALVNMGSAGAVILVVIIFLRTNSARDSAYLASMEKRDEAFRQWFAIVNKNNADDICKIVDSMEKLSMLLDKLSARLDTHDANVVTRFESAINTILRETEKQRKGRE